MGLGQVEQGLDDLEIAAGLGGKSSRPGVPLITAHVAREDYDRALAAVAAMERKPPHDPAVHNLRGQGLRGQGGAAGAAGGLREGADAAA